MTDRAAELAAYLVTHTHDFAAGAGLAIVLAERWPGISTDEIRRGFSLAQDALRGIGAGYMADADALAAVADAEAGRS